MAFRQTTKSLPIQSMKTTQLVNRSLLVRLSISSFIGNPRDKKLTAEAESNHNTENKRLSVRKRIMQSKELNTVLMIAGQLRKAHESLSLPWFDGGFRLVPSAKFIQTKQTLDKLIGEFEQAADTFIANYDNILNSDRAALNGTFDLADYPSRQELRAKFRATIECSPIPVTAEDWRVSGIDQMTQDEIAKQVESQTHARLAAGKAELLNNIKQAVQHLAKRLKDSDATFKANSINNVIEAAQSLSSLNVTEDAALDNASNAIVSAFSAIDAEACRNSKKLRANAVELCESTLQEIDATMAGVM